MLSQMRKQLIGLSRPIAAVERQIGTKRHQTARRVDKTDDRQSLLPTAQEQTSITWPTREEEYAAAVAETERQLYSLQSALQTEGIDPQWAGGAEQSIKRELERLQMTDLQLVGVECGTTLCRFEVTTNGSSPSETSFRKLAGMRAWLGQRFTRADHAGGYAEVYLARQGRDLPLATNN
jgi:hypothetical protein